MSGRRLAALVLLVPIPALAVAGSLVPLPGRVEQVVATLLPGIGSGVTLEPPRAATLSVGAVGTSPSAAAAPRRVLGTTRTAPAEISPVRPRGTRARRKLEVPTLQPVAAQQPAKPSASQGNARPVPTQPAAADSDAVDAEAPGHVPAAPTSFAAASPVKLLVEVRAAPPEATPPVPAPPDQAPTVSAGPVSAGPVSAAASVDASGDIAASAAVGGAEVAAEASTSGADVTVDAPIADAGTTVSVEQPAPAPPAEITAPLTGR